MENQDRPTPSPTGPGCLMLAAIMGGTVIGLRSHQPSAGVVAGVAAAVLIALVIWVWDRRRR